jgi:RNase P subunit RPR2
MPVLKFETSVEVEGDFEVFCAKCNSGLCNGSDFRKSHGRGYDQLVVEPCETCLKAARDEAFEDGRIHEREES